MELLLASRTPILVWIIVSVGGLEHLRRWNGRAVTVLLDIFTICHCVTAVLRVIRERMRNARRSIRANIVVSGASNQMRVRGNSNPLFVGELNHHGTG